VRRVESREVRDLPAWLSQQPGGSWAQSDPGGAGEDESSADNDGTARDCQTSWVRQARPEGTREEPVVKLCRRVTGSNLVDMGRVAVHDLLSLAGVDSDTGLRRRVRGHGECLRRSHGDAAGAELGADLADRFHVNTGTI
jgi:hypothetical protein